MGEPQQSEFLVRAREALGELFGLAQAKDELNFALSLAPEFRAYTRTSALDAHCAFEEYSNFLAHDEFKRENIRARVALAFYCHVAEAEGFWGVPMCLLGVLEGQEYNLRPFECLVRKHKITGQSVAPNANRVMSAMAGCADSLGLKSLATVFRDAFDADIRNAFAHADYALSREGLHVRGRHDRARLISWSQFDIMFRDGVGLYQVLQALRKQYHESYGRPKIGSGASHPRDPIGYWKLHYDAEAGTMTISGGPGWTPEALAED